MRLGATTATSRKKTLHKCAPGYYEQTVPQKDTSECAYVHVGFDREHLTKATSSKEIHRVGHSTDMMFRHPD